MLFYTGFADEAGKGIDAQIKATLELGWKNIESRNIDGTNIHNLSDEAFDIVEGKLKDAGVHINCFGSEIANWGKDPRKTEDFEISKAMLKRAIPRMQRLGTKLLRGMSFAAIKDGVPDSPEIENKVFSQVRELVKMCADAGITYGHENCMNYGGMSYKHTLKLIEAVDHKNFTLIFDTGNPPFTYNRVGEAPYKKQSAWEFYSNVKEFIHYVHIKDAKYIAESEGVFPKAEFTFPGDGDGDVKKIVTDLLANGFDGGFSIEPHMTLVFHEADKGNEDSIKFSNYVEYGKRFMKLVDECRAK